MWASLSNDVWRALEGLARKQAAHHQRAAASASEWFDTWERHSQGPQRLRHVLFFSANAALAAFGTLSRGQDMVRTGRVHAAQQVGLVCGSSALLRDAAPGLASQSRRALTRYLCGQDKADVVQITQAMKLCERGLQQAWGVPNDPEPDWRRGQAALTQGLLLLMPWIGQPGVAAAREAGANVGFTDSARHQDIPARASRHLSPEPGATRPESLAGPSSSHWIEIELIGEDDRPIGHEAYDILLPDGRLVSGRLDANGFARHGEIETAGTCQVRFPRLDKGAWERLSPRGS